MQPAKRIVLDNNSSYHRDVFHAAEPFTTLIVCRDSSKVDGNYVTIELATPYKNGTKAIDEYAQQRLQELGAKINYWKAPPNKTIAPLNFEVKHHQHVAQVVDWLFRHEYLYAENKTQIDSSVNMLVMSSEFAASNPQERMRAQKVLSPYAERIMNVASDNAAAIGWLGDMLEALCSIDGEDCVTWFLETNPHVAKDVARDLYLLAYLYSYPNYLATLFEGQLCPELSDPAIKKIVWDLLDCYKRPALVHNPVVKVSVAPNTELHFSLGKTVATRVTLARDVQEGYLDAIKELAVYEECSCRDATKKLFGKEAGSYLLRPDRSEDTRVVLSFVNADGRIEHSRLKVCPKGKILCGPHRIDINEYLANALFLHSPKVKAGKVLCEQKPTWKMVWDNNVATIVQLSECSAVQNDAGITVELRDEQIRYRGQDETIKEGLTFRTFSLVKDFETRYVQLFTYENWEEGVIPNADLLQCLIEDVKSEKSVVVQSSGSGKTNEQLFVSKYLA